MNRAELEQALTSPLPENRMQALKAAYESKHPHVVDVVLDLFPTESHPKIRGVCAWVVGKLGNDAQVARLAAYVSDPEARVRIQLVQAMGRSTSPAVLTKLVVMLGLDEDGAVRDACAAVLMAGGRERLLSQFRRILDATDPTARRGAIKAAALFRSPLVVPILKQGALICPDPARQDALQGLETLAVAGIADARRALDEIASAAPPASPPKRPEEEVPEGHEQDLLNTFASHGKKALKELVKEVTEASGSFDGTLESSGKIPQQPGLGARASGRFRAMPSSEASPPKTGPTPAAPGTPRPQSGRFKALSGQTDRPPAPAAPAVPEEPEKPRTPPPPPPGPGPRRTGQFKPPGAAKPNALDKLFQSVAKAVDTPRSKSKGKGAAGADSARSDQPWRRIVILVLVGLALLLVNWKPMLGGVQAVKTARELNKAEAENQWARLHGLVLMLVGGFGAAGTVAGLLTLSQVRAGLVLMTSYRICWGGYFSLGVLTLNKYLLGLGLLAFVMGVITKYFNPE